jgi:hypothetical protein
MRDIPEKLLAVILAITLLVFLFILSIGAVVFMQYKQNKELKKELLREKDENFPIQIELTRYQTTLGLLRERSPECATIFEETMTNETE